MFYPLSRLIMFASCRLWSDNIVHRALHCVCVCVCVCLSVCGGVCVFECVWGCGGVCVFECVWGCGGVGVWAKVVFPTGICTGKSWLLWVSNGGMACLSVHMHIGAGGVR